MNAVVEQIMQEESDFIRKKMQEHHDVLMGRAIKWIAAKDKYLPVLRAFQVIGAYVAVDTEGRITVTMAGTKEEFVKCWKLWRSIGVRLEPAAPGSTQVYQFLQPFDCVSWFHFTSTVCKRVKVGTKMVEQDIYETQCGDDLATVDMKELEGPSGSLVPLSGSNNDKVIDDDLPF